MSASLTHHPPAPAPAPSPDPAARTRVTAQAGTAFVRIGLAGPSGRADLAVPAAVPLAPLLPTLLHHTGEDPGPDGGVRHGGWVLRRADGTRLDAAASLGEQGVTEGDLLFLAHGNADATPPLYDDVVEVIGEHGVRTTWPARATRYGAAALTALALLTGCAAFAVAPGAVPGWLALTTAVLALAVGVLASRGFDDVHAGTFAGLLAVPPAVVGAVRLLGAEHDASGLGSEHLLLACAMVAVFGVLGPVLVGGGDGAFAALVVAGPLGAVGAVICTIWRDVTPTEAASVAGPLALALTTLWPTVALRVARIPTPQLAATTEELERLPSQLAHEQLTARVTAARRVLGGMILGSHLVAGGATLWLFAATELWAGVLGGTLTVLMLLRARLFKELGQVATALATALAAAAGAAVFTVTDRAAQTAPLLGVLVPVVLTVTLVAGGVGLAAGRRRPNPRLARTLDVLETTLLVAVVPFVLAVWEVYGALLNMRA
ncbi:type VII secretion integral membrane protein EccD [Streptomyces litchfieldiae]|uniref:Type VII secretion integral membrane protein EccD n=1 Tax=Streptomyces litchfieldiae TaxID=3075543 RepID=A0ABU2MKV3_9ACTN|nr:type VII secretion integral membrane protein EccD [Streptomyces sp. DSM 44938]MDT0341289.1 type VII secretion integral membrane protein EccD [Streptomyces sp. DSM 44938]